MPRIVSSGIENGSPSENLSAEQRPPPCREGRAAGERRRDEGDGEKREMEERVLDGGAASRAAEREAPRKDRPRVRRPTQAGSARRSSSRRRASELPRALAAISRLR